MDEEDKPKKTKKILRKSTKLEKYDGGNEHNRIKESKSKKKRHREKHLQKKIDRQEMNKVISVVKDDLVRGDGSFKKMSMDRAIIKKKGY